MATHSRILAWEIPWTVEPGGLQSMGSHSWSEQLSLSTFIVFLLHRIEMTGEIYEVFMS